MKPYVKCKNKGNVDTKRVSMIVTRNEYPDLYAILDQYRAIQVIRTLETDATKEDHIAEVKRATAIDATSSINSAYARLIQLNDLANVISNDYLLSI